ncbi:MAG: ABC transporter permease [Anaerolineae bacterium]|nr:ABC transporter permease [Anaerolineae bacterium]
MKRFFLLLLHEFRLARATLPIHAVAIIEPAVMYALMTVILVHPTFDMHIQQSDDATTQALVVAMQEVGSPIGLPYIEPVMVDFDQPHNVRQVIAIEEREGIPTAVQRYNLIDQNLVKNYRNRLTAAALRLWNADLGARAVTVVEYPTRPWDVPYNVYFGMAMLPMAAFLAATMLGGVLTTQEFEIGTVLEQRLASASLELILAARLTRLAITSLLSAGLVMLATGLINGYWPDSIGLVGLILLPVAIIGGCLGVIAGLAARATLPAFLIGLVTSFAGWLLGNAFKPAVSIGGWYEFFSRFSPNTYAVELFFPRFYGVEMGSMLSAALILIGASLAMIVLTTFIYRRALSAWG